MNDWKELDAHNLPESGDILTPGAWEFHEGHPEVNNFPAPCAERPMQILYYLLNHYPCHRFYIRRPDGWGPKKCPKCGSEDKGIYKSERGCYSKTFCHPWHDETKDSGREIEELKRHFECMLSDTDEIKPYKIKRYNILIGRISDESKRLSHEMIMTPRYWRANSGVWMQIHKYDPSARLYFVSTWESASWFINRQSADIPPKDV